jgi:excisionase family DNA binding protein
MTSRCTASGNPPKDTQRLERLWTVNQLAEHCQLSPRTIHRMIDQELLPVLRFGRAVRIHPKVVAELGSPPWPRSLQDPDADGQGARSAPKAVPPNVQRKKTRGA